MVRANLRMRSCHYRISTGGLAPLAYTAKHHTPDPTTSTHRSLPGATPETSKYQHCEWLELAKQETLLRTGEYRGPPPTFFIFNHPILLVCLYVPPSLLDAASLATTFPIISPTVWASRRCFIRLCFEISTLPPKRVLLQGLMLNTQKWLPMARPRFVSR